MSARRDANGSQRSAASNVSAEKDMTPTSSGNTLPNKERKRTLFRWRSWKSLRQSWTKAGLNTTTVLMMMKSGLSPAIASALLQIDAIKNLFPGVGFIYPVIAFLSIAFLPRSKFIQSMTLSVLSISAATAVAQLAVYTSIKARQAAPSPPAADGSPGYNSSASAVLGVWLFVLIWAVSSVRAKFPQFTFPVILSCVFLDVICTAAQKLPTVMDGVRLVRTVYFAFMLGFGTGTAVHFLIFPLSMRTVIFLEFSGFYKVLRSALKAQLAYFHSLEDPENVKRGIGDLHETRKNPTPQVQAVRGSFQAMQGAHAKLHQDLSAAKREVAYGHIGPDHINDMFKMNHKLFLPVAGLGAVVTVFEQIEEVGNLMGSFKEHKDWRETKDERRDRIAFEWAEYMRQLHDTIDAYVNIIDEGIEHIMVVLGLKHPGRWTAVEIIEGTIAFVSRLFKSRKREEPLPQPPTPDTERNAGNTMPGSENFTAYYRSKIEDLYSNKEVTLRFWCKRRGIELSDDFFDHPETASFEFQGSEAETQLAYRRSLRLLYTLFYIEYLFNAIARGVLQYAELVDRWRLEGVFSKKRLILPGRRRLKKWLYSIFKSTGLSHNDEQSNPEHSNIPKVDLGAAYNRRRNPEHLPPNNWMERAGEHVRSIPAFLRSHASQFGFRVALATMTIGILAFIRMTQDFFSRERIHWALFVVALSMSPTAGASVFALIGRILGNVYAMLICFVIWYVPDQKTAGIIVFIWFFVSLTSFILVCQPRFFSYGTVSIIAILVIAGYELNRRDEGPAKSSSDAPYYKITHFGPLRLLVAVIGSVVAFIWTIFPFPISEHGLIRQGLGDALYLLANYQSLVTELARARVREKSDAEIDKGPDDPLSPEYWLERYREKVLSKLTVCLAGLRNYMSFLKFEIPVGGRFPREQYEEIIQLVNSLFNFLSLVNLASRSLNECIESQSEWSRDFRQALDSAILTNKEITILLSLFSASITNGMPVPPYLFTPEPYHLADELEKLNKDVFGLRRLNEPYHAAFGVMQVSATSIVKDIDDLLTNVKMLVGELDFSFHLSSTSDDAATTLSPSRTLDLVKSREKRD